ncbi:hypothetical protein SAMN05444170_5944 [Bradyrhizobium erythrophlei]|uniref:Uncharacterized protein n=1 Tax=Bradyrhizobium erythrophlei TaxID=1437360 RepID=A0A1M7UNP5_9BRAD|nr:hypothetical protein SAMN05444170_5944 [Bradyrhizobium erythrophlei]
MGLLPVGGIDGSLRSGTPISCDSMRSAAGASSFPGSVLCSTRKATFIMENSAKEPCRKPGSGLLLSVVEARRGIGSSRFITDVIKHAMLFLSIVIKHDRELSLSPVTDGSRWPCPGNSMKTRCSKPQCYVFWNNGDEATPMRDLAGMTTPSLYNAPAIREPSTRLMFDRYIRLALENCSAISGGDDPPLRALGAVLRCDRRTAAYTGESFSACALGCADPSKCI